MQTRYKLSKLEIKNYKCLVNFLFNFQENNLLVFDGPNGYGKTTCFEALEILFTKKPRKINNINLDKRYKYKNSPIHHNDSEQIEISIQLISDNEQIEIKRIFPPAENKESKKNNISTIFDESKLYINNIEAPEKKLEDILNYDNLNNLFNVLNYVEQDENTYFLKEDPKNRYKALVSLLGGDEERLLLERVTIFSDKLQNRVDFYKKSIEAIKQENKELLENDLYNIEYNKLIEETNEFLWDNVTIKNTDIDIHNSYLNDIKKIETLFNHKNIITDLILRKRIDTFKNNDSFLINFIKNYWSIENFDLLKEQNVIRNEYLKILEKNNIIIQNIDYKNYNYLSSDDTIEFLSTKTDVSFQLNSYKIAVATVIASQNNLSIQSRILADLKEKRGSLIEFSKSHLKDINIKDSECPTCGYDWQNFEVLSKNIEETEHKIFSDYEKNNNLFEELKTQLNTDYLNPLKALLSEKNEEINNNISQLISSETFSYLSQLYDNLKKNIDIFFSLFKDDTKQKLLSDVNHKILEIEENAIKEKLILIIDEEKPNIQIEINADIILSDFKRYFNDDMNSLDKLTSVLIENKKQYIEWQYYNSISNSILEYSKQLEEIETFKHKIDNIKCILDDEIKKYTKSIIENISIPFYIYTGKILQNHSLGSGLIIDFEIDRMDSQIYIRPTHRDQEVTYTLSSGQLSATVISLMLVLNKVFNHSKLGTVLIDDPLQTLDEINLHSLVELLKYNFSDQQLFISTHEDRYSRFIRYKYDKFGLNGKNINMKEEMSFRV
ncbi:AAA family ATPase [Dysgonomonas capnocytophagoides]|uniref:AAA family ATPase n=1 Tax=Dysgonomonas capnocytophagoides TaxID=45254 RepID=UPI00333FE964